MKIAILAPIAWRTPPIKYGPWEQIASTIAEGLQQKGMDVTLFATKKAVTNCRLDWVCQTPYEENRQIDAKVAECLHISNVMEKANQYDVIHNHFDFLPLTYSRGINTPMLTTIHGFSNEQIVEVYKKYNQNTAYISISDANRHPSLQYLDTIYHGIEAGELTFKKKKEDYLLFFGRIHPDKGTHDAITIAKQSGHRIKIAGLIQDQQYFEKKIKPFVDDDTVQYVGNADKKQRDELLSNAKALLHPIYFEEPFGLSVVESLFCGTPVIAYQRGSMPEIIEHTKTGFLVQNVTEAVEAVKQLHTIDVSYCSMYSRKKFGVSKMIDSYIRAYQQIVKL